MRDLKPDETFPALRGVSFQVPKGSHLRRHRPQRIRQEHAAQVRRRHHPADAAARVTVNGRISALIELGAGFHPEISGRENVFINGIMLGLIEDARSRRRFDEIVEFAELEDFIDAPVKTYSSGMYMRLGFAVAIHVDPDVLLVDEVLAVGDEGFTHKCLDKFGEFRRRGKTILLVTHSLGLVERFCDEALWLDEGQARPTAIRGASSAPTSPTSRRAEEAAAPRRSRRALRRPTASAAGEASRDRAVAATRRAPSDDADGHVPRHEGRWGSREVEITGVTLSATTGSRPRVPLRRAADRPARRAARHAGHRLRLRRSACSTPTASAATAPTPTSRSCSRESSAATAR